MKGLVLLFVVLSTWVTCIGAEDFKFDLTTLDDKSYTNVITRLRNYLKGSTCFEIPMIGQPSKSPTYVQIELKISTNQNILVALRKSDAYVVGYEDTFKGQQRAFILKESPKTVAKDAFPKAKQVVELQYGGSYQDLENDRGIKSRKNVDLTAQTFKSTAAKIFGEEKTEESTFKTNQHKFFILAVTTISEAMRFQYMATNVGANLQKASSKLDDKMYKIVNEWDPLSTAVSKANSDKTLQPGISAAIGPKGEKIPVTTVGQVQKEVPLLKYVKPCEKKAKSYCGKKC